MGRTKKTEKQRDKEAMRRNLIEGLRKYIAKHGFKNLTAAQIADRLDIHASNINKIFGGLDGLVKHLVTEHDYWKPFFEKFSLQPNAKAWQILEMFKQLMTANFDAFFDNEDMQHVILGQVSVDDEIMRQISENREQDAAQLLALADKNFENSGKHFRAVLALLLGGSYYIVWHAKNNKSTVCEMDINMEKDYQELKDTIEYIIDLVWKDAGKRRKRAR